VSDVLGRFIEGQPALLVALVTLLLASTGVWQIARALGAAAAGEGFSVYWQVGGFGTPGRGWRVSAPLVQLLAGLTLVTLAVAVAPSAGSVAAIKAKPTTAPASAAQASSASSPSAPSAGASAPASAASR
jgi:hypothetical protein